MARRIDEFFLESAALAAAASAGFFAAASAGLAAALRRVFQTRRRALAGRALKNGFASAARDRSADAASCLYSRRLTFVRVEFYGLRRRFADHAVAGLDAGLERVFRQSQLLDLRSGRAQNFRRRCAARRCRGCGIRFDFRRFRFDRLVRRNLRALLRRDRCFSRCGNFGDWRGFGGRLRLRLGFASLGQNFYLPIRFGARAAASDCGRRARLLSARRFDDLRLCGGGDFGRRVRFKRLLRGVFGVGFFLDELDAALGRRVCFREVFVANFVGEFLRDGVRRHAHVRAFTPKVFDDVFRVFL